MQVYFYDDNYFYTNTDILNEEELKDKENFTTIAPKNGFLKPKWNKEEKVWEEGAAATEIILGQMTTPQNSNFDFQYILLKILEMMQKGGVSVDTNWFFQYVMYQWTIDGIDENYLNLCVATKMLTEQQVALIKATPKLK